MPRPFLPPHTTTPLSYSVPYTPTFTVSHTLCFCCDTLNTHPQNDSPFIAMGMYWTSAFLDVFDGVAARALNQCGYSKLSLFSFSPFQLNRSLPGSIAHLRSPLVVCWLIPPPLCITCLSLIARSLSRHIVSLSSTICLRFAVCPPRIFPFFCLYL